MSQSHTLPSGSKARMFRIFLPYILKQKRVLQGAFLALLVATGIRLLEPWPLAFAIDLIVAEEISANNVPDKLAALASWSQHTSLWFCAGAVIVIAVLRASISYFSTVGLALAGSRVLSEIRLDLFTHLLRLPLKFHHQAKVGDLTMRLVNDIAMLREVTISALMPLLSSLIILLGMFGIMLFLDWKLTLVALLPLPLLVWMTRRASRKISDVSRGQRKREGVLAAKVAEYISGIATVQALSLESSTIKSLRADDAQSLRQNVQTKRLTSGLERRVDILLAFTTGMVLLNGSMDVLASRMSPGDLLVFLSYMKNAFRPVREYAKYTGRLSKAVTAGERIVDLLNQPPASGDRPNATVLATTPGDIRFHDVHFSYQTENAPAIASTLQGASFQLPAGQFVAITGPSGAGKSTLINLLLRLYDPDAGTIEIAGQDIRNYTIESIRQQIGYVPQDNLLFGITVRQNITLAAHGDVTEEETIAAAKLANAHDFIMALPQGYDTLISEKGHSLSGGQRQRIAIARAAIRNTPFLILDEPGVGLDSKNEALVIHALLRLMRGRTCLVITHNLSLAARADRILFIDNGTIAEQGTHDALLAMRGRYREFWQLQHSPLPHSPQPQRTTDPRKEARYTYDIT
ncbi:MULTISPECIES: ABC transporter ATP-binding protein [Enterobacterales]|uniref:ABC transporter ATP-binding protein n=1 Tax=Enterobacterales TaxID=91347 RepID=UPI002EDAEC2B